MPLSFQSRRVGDITVVECSGRIVQGAESAQLQQHVDDLLPVNRHILLHLGDVDFIDVTSLGVLLSGAERFREEGNRLSVWLGSGAAVPRLLELCGGKDELPLTD